MTFFGAIVIGIIIGAIGGVLKHFLDPDSEKKPWKSKKSRKPTPWDKDPFFGTPLQKF